MPPDTKADTDVSFDYDGRTADLIAKTRSRGEELLDLGAHVEARARDLVAGASGNGARALAWTASGHVRLLSFPLESLPSSQSAASAAARAASSRSTISTRTPG